LPDTLVITSESIKTLEYKMEREIAVMIPIIVTLIIGLVIVTAIFYRSREKQLLIERGLTPEQIKEFYQEKKDPYRLMKIGMVILFFGLGLGLGLVLQEETGKDYWVPFLMFTITGLGFIIANVASKSLEKKTTT
jgi:hypothetical protein